MQHVTPQSVEVFVERLLQVNQGTLPWAVAPVFQRRDHYPLGIFRLTLL